jgi:nicotinamide phosphoribosyltransferase
MTLSNVVSPLFLIDSYKHGHAQQYPPDTQQVWSNWTARGTRVPGQEHVVWFGLQAAIKDILLRQWQEGFFDVPLRRVLEDYTDLIRATLGVPEPQTAHIQQLHRLGYLPLDIWALPEGSRVPIGVPMLVITNTDARCYWLPNYLETVLSAHLWKPTTSATTASRFRALFIRHAQAFGEKDLSFVDWQGHDFSYRGMSGNQDAIMSGMGHLLSFNGTDTVPAILAAQEYYGAPLNCGGSVSATEHSVMCAGTQEAEDQTYDRLLFETYPAGIVSIVSDTWNLWRVLTEYIPSRRERILARDGKFVCRPDSGDPVKVVAGDPDAPVGSPERIGALGLLAKAMGTDGRGHINKAGLIYGDGISLERADRILGAARDKGLSPFNVVFGIGSWTYEHVTRDEYNFAMKATAVRRSGKILDIFKKPITADSGFSKSSLVGIPHVHRHIEGCDKKGLYVVDRGTPEHLDQCAFQKVYSNGRLLVEQSFDEIRQRVRSL